jgi:hypothetical protein
MSKPMLGMVVGGALGLLDGASAWASPEARPIILGIVAGSTIKGVVTGLLAGLIARRWHSTPLGIGAGVVFGFGLSALAAIGQGDHYAEIVIPGMLLGAIVGFVTQRYPPAAGLPTGVVVALALGMSTSFVAAQAPAPDPLAPLAGLVGKWVGTSEGRPGKGTAEREYTRVWNARYVRVRNRSVYPPQEQNPKGETHEDEGWFSFDRSRKRIVFRQFHIEGFVNQYVADGESAATTVVFVTEAIENIPPGWRARETYVLHGPDEFEEVFELAEGGKEFEVYSRTRFKRVR